MRMKVMQLGVNMRRQVITILRPSLDFMVSLKPTKAHDMVAIMLDLQFKDLSLVIDYVDHFFTIEIVATYDKNSFFLPPRLCTRSTMDDPILLPLLCKNLCAILMLFLEWEYLRRRFVLNKLVLSKYYFFGKHIWKTL